MKLKCFRLILEKYSNNKFNGHPSSESRVVPCEWTNGQPGMTNLIVAFRSFASAPNGGSV